MSKNKILNTSSTFLELQEGAIQYKSRRNQQMLINSSKSLRNFTRAEASAYLSLDPKTLDKYVSNLGIDPRRHDDAQWSIDIKELYLVRDSLPSELRKEQHFKRSEGQSCQVIVVQNQKGGVGKTVSAATIASGLATEFHQEFKIGLVDMDGQATLTMYYATESALDGCLSVGDLMMGNVELDEGETLKEAISGAFLKTTIPNLRILPASQSDRAIEGWFHEGISSKKIKKPYEILANILDEVKDEFDIIIIDTPPALGYATYNSYYAGTSTIFPLTANENDIDATCSYFEYIPHVWSLIMNSGHQGFDFIKILLTNHRDSSTTTERVNALTDSFSSYIYSKEFKNSEAVRQSSTFLCSVFDLSKSEYPKSKGSFQLAQQNAYEVTSQVLRDLQKVWKSQLKVNNHG